MGFRNYLDAKSTDNCLEDWFPLGRQTGQIVSLQSLSLVNLELYHDGMIVMDEVRSLAAIIPGGGTATLDNTTTALKILCSGAKYRVAMDVDVSADGVSEFTI